MAKNDKSTALLKKVKIDKAQRNMFIAVCLASVVVGVTLVASVWFVRKIKFNQKVIGQQDIIIKDLKQSQANLNALKLNIAELTSNENLEAVARIKESKNNVNNKVCDKFVNAEINNEEGVKDIETARTCSALRLIPDALPSIENNEATLGSFDTLISSHMNVESLSSDTGRGYESGTDDASTSDTLHTTNTIMSAVDNQSKIYNGLLSIERSIRNYDITNATIKWSDESRNGDSIELNATFAAYYANEVVPAVKSRRICADAKNKVCVGQGGDESVGE